jgi:hypothetical protein
VSRLFDIDILPESLGDKPENIHLAWLGDKILGIHAANCIVDIFGRPIHRGVASEIHSKAVSNKFLRNHFGSLVPILVNAQDIEPKLTDEIAGAVVETATDRITILSKISLRFPRDLVVEIEGQATAPVRLRLIHSTSYSKTISKPTLEPTSSPTSKPTLVPTPKPVDKP